MRFKHFLNHGLKFAALGSTVYLSVVGSKEFSYSLGLPGKSKNNYIDLRGEKRFDSYTLNDALENLTSNKYVGHVMFTVEQLAIIDKNPALKQLKEKIDEQIIENNKSYHRHPSDFVHGLLSSHVYEDSTQNTVVKFKAKEKHEKYGKYLEGWVVYDVFNDGNRGYYGAIYINEAEKQMVLAHRGTTTELMDLIRSESPWKTNFEGIIGGKIVPQQAKAFEIAKLAAKYAQDNGYNLSITGHSLGALLAEQSVYFCYNDYGNIKAVTFDSPGSGETYNSFKSSVKNPKSKVDTINFDIVTYVSKPNFVNSCNTHVARMYELPTEIQVLPESMNKILSKLPSQIKENEFFLHGLLSITDHKLDLMLEAFNPETGRPKICKEVLNWPRIKYTSKDQSPLDFVRKQLDSQGLAGKVAGKFLIDAVELTTFGSLIRVAGDILNGGTNQKQYWKFFELANKGQNVLDEAGFALGYEAGYQVEVLNSRKDILNTGNIGSADWYLSQLDQCTHARLDKIKSDIVRKQLKEIKDLYKIEIDHRGKVVVESRSSTFSPDQIREWLMNLVSATKSESDFSVGSILENHNELGGVQVPKMYPPQSVESGQEQVSYGSIVIPPLPQKNYKKFIGRKEVLKEIEDTLHTKQYVAISAVGGTGKTTAVLEYAHRKQAAKETVIWIDADSEAKISTSYNNISRKYEFDKLSNKHGMLDSPWSKLSGSEFLLIFDNVEKYAHVKPYLDKLPPQVKVIITTRYNFNVPQLKQIVLKEFSQKEVKEYLEANLGERSDLQILAEKVGSLPYRLNKAVGIFKEKPLLSIWRYLKDYAGNKSETELLFEKLSTSSDKSRKTAWNILKYAAQLDPDFIPVKIFEEVLSLGSDDLEESIKELQLFNFVEVIWKKDEPGLKLHRLVQEEVQDHIAHEGKIATKENLNEKLLLSLTTLMPCITNNSTIEEKNAAELFSSQVVKVLENLDEKNLDKSVQDYLANLYTSLACFYAKVEDNFHMAIKFQEYTLKISQDLDNMKNVAISLNNIGAWYGSLKQPIEQLKYYERSLVVYQKLNDLDRTALSNIASAYELLGDNAKALLLYKQSYNVVVSKLGLNDPQTITLKEKIEKLKPGSINYNHQFIQKRGKTDEDLINVKQIIQGKILKTIHNHAVNGGSYWSYGSIWCIGLCESGIKGYLDDSYLSSQLGKLSTLKNVEIAKMLIFETINLGTILNAMDGKQDLTCVREFAKLYPNLVKKIIKEHPEYFVDGIIAKEIVKDHAELRWLLSSGSFDGKGVLEHEEESYWYQYSNEAMDQLLKLRLESAEIEGVKTINPNYIWDGSVAVAERLISEILIASIDNEKILITLNLYGRHWVGLDILRTEDKIEISYMDSEQNEVPTLLKEQLIKILEIFYPEYHITLNEVVLELQKYNNCGPEAIENLVLQHTGNRLEQEDAVVGHSILLENMLLGEQTHELCAL